MKAQKPGLHPRNRHHQRYDLPALCQAHPDLQGYITLNPLGEQTIDFANPQAVKAFVEAAAASTEYMLSAEDAPAVAAAQGIVPSETVAKKAIPNCNLVCITGEEMRSIAEDMLSMLYDANPKSVGGALPDDAFYAKLD